MKKLKNIVRQSVLTALGLLCFGCETVELELLKTRTLLQ